MADKKDKSDEKKKPQKGIPIENENVSKDPNRSPRGDDKDKNIKNPHGDHIEPYNRKNYQDRNN